MKIFRTPEINKISVVRKICRTGSAGPYQGAAREMFWQGKEMPTGFVWEVTGEIINLLMK
ncbi:MAG: hypothetical protein CVV32_08245 [Methanomicrobiales archaeon HGW-Methanomicrobiales-3]|nr:MAG: hypothetical protein CVV32_08245 [Methanomicrobiales archaeon HGW-Methanomicrobiales-3]